MPDRDADRDQESEQPGRGRGAKHGHRLLKVAALGGAVALVLNEDVRNHVLDILFGAEEEFDYSSVTEPPTPATPPDGDSPTEPWVRSAPRETPPDAEADPAKPDANGEAPSALAANEARSVESTPRGTASISPSPAAWRAAAAEDETGFQSAKQASAPDGGSAIRPPEPPPGWWAPSAGGIDPLDG